MKTSKTLKTVNVLEAIDGEVKQLVAFPDDKKGNTRAENLFCQLCLENQPEDRSNWQGIDYHIHEGCYSDGGYFLYLIHSS